MMGRNYIKVLLFLICVKLMLLPCSGMICFQCETQTSLTSDGNEAKAEIGTVGKYTGAARTTEKIEGTGTAGTEKIGTFEKGDLPDDAGDDDDDKDGETTPMAIVQYPPCTGDKTTWMEEECDSRVMACYKLSGKLYIKDDLKPGVFKVVKRGCWKEGNADDIVQSYVIDQGKVGECKSVNTGRDKGDASSTADLCVCDDQNMPCNRGGKKSAINTINIIIIIFINLFILNLWTSC